MTAMPMTSPDRIELSDAQRRELDRLIRAGSTEQRLALRADIVLRAADGHPNARIAASIKWKSTSLSLLEKLCPPTTAMISMSSSNSSPRSGHATTRPRSRSSGSSPPPTGPTPWTDSTDTGQRSAPTQHNPAPPDPRRTYERDHQVAMTRGPSTFFRCDIDARRQVRHP